MLKQPLKWQKIRAKEGDKNGIVIDNLKEGEKRE